MTTVNAPDWPALFKLAPEMWPLDESDSIELCGLPGYDCISRRHTGLYARVYAAICRDAAVRFLGENGVWVGMDGGECSVSTIFCGQMESLADALDHPSRDHALHAACLAVIRARRP